MKTKLLSRHAIIVFILFFFSIGSFSQIKLKKINAFVNPGVDMLSKYIWRGADFGDSPAIQPSINFKKGNLTIGTWGSFSTNHNGFKEIDLYLSYTYKDFIDLTITDYFVVNASATFPRYFNYRDYVTNHVLEISTTLGGLKNLPLSLMIATNIYGVDAKKADGKNAYSTYIELKYSNMNIDIFAGYNATAPDTDLGESGYYGDKAGFVNIGCTVTKHIRLNSRFSVPFFVSFITNPVSDKVFLVAGVSL